MVMIFSHFFGDNPENVAVDRIVIFLLSTFINTNILFV